MKLFQPIRDINDLVKKGVDSTRETIDNLLGKGFKGGIKDVFDFSAEGLIQKADFDLGIGILHLTMDGDQESVQTAIKFRNDLAARLVELDEMAGMVKTFKAEDLSEVKRGARQMAAFLDRGAAKVEKPPPPIDAAV